MVRWQEVPALLYSSHVDLLLGVADARGNDAILPRLAPVVNIPPSSSQTDQRGVGLPNVSGKEIGQYYFSLPVLKVPYSIFTRKGLGGSRLSDVSGKAIVVEKTALKKNIPLSGLVQRSYWQAIRWRSFIFFHRAI